MLICMFHLPQIEPPGSTSECYDSNTCPAPMYIRDGEYLGGYSNNDAIAPLVCGEEYCEEDWGLDVYETEFFLDPVTWKSAGIYEVALKFDVVDFTDDIFYFCHNHQFMTGRIKFVDSEGVALNAVDTPEIPYNYDSPSEYDQSCGTHGLGDYQLPNDQCPSTFVCNAPPESTPVGQFANCIDTMNCAMTVGMTTNVNQDNALALFIHQMIPHHQNAVNMCKALMASGEMYCDDITWEDTPDCNMSVLCYEIINDQNYQIQVMRRVLDNLTFDETDDCEVNISGGGASAAPSAVPPLAPTTNGDTIDSLRKTISDLEASSLATIESLEESIVQKDSIIANLSLQIENIGAGPVALPTEVPTAGPIARPAAGPIAKQKKTSKKSKK